MVRLMRGAPSRAVVAAASVVAAAAALAACSGDGPAPAPPTAATSPSISAPSTSTGAPTPAIPELPEAAQVGDAAGAEAFVRYWVEVLNYAYVSGDTEPLDMISEAGCATCTSLMDVVEKRRRENVRLEGGFMSVISIASPPPENGVITVTVNYEQAPGTEVSEEGARTEVPGEPPGTLGFVVAYEDAHWELAGVGR